MEKYGISVYSTRTGLKSVIAERNLKTVLTKIYKLLDHQNSFKWLDYVREIQYSFNHTHHSSLPKSYTPAQVISDKKIIKEVRLNYQRKEDTKNKKYEKKLKRTSSFSSPSIQQGDYVRVLNKRDIFTKSYVPRFSEKISRVTQVRSWTTPISYKVENTNKIYYKPELSLVHITPSEKEKLNYYVSQKRNIAERTTRSGKKSNFKTEYLVRSVSDKSFSHWLSEEEVTKLRKKGQILDLSESATGGEEGSTGGRKRRRR